MDLAEAQASESTNADLRRESRRKKILQTAKARLEKLNGGTRTADAHFVDSPAAEVLDYSDPEVEPNFPIGNIFSQEDRTYYSTTNFNTVNADVHFVRGRIHIFVASLVGYILSQYVVNSLFIPVFLCIIIELLYFKGQQYPNNNIISLVLPIALLFTSAFLSNKIKQFNYLFHISQSIITNLAINIFCICLSSYFLQHISISHVVNIK